MTEPIKWNRITSWAKEQLNKHFYSDGFWDWLVKRGIFVFNETTDDIYEVRKKVEIYRQLRRDKTKIMYYKSFLPWSKSVGHSSKHRLIIFFNRRKYLTKEEQILFLSHETLHLVGYSHKGNFNNDYNSHTVPYEISREFVAYLNSLIRDESVEVKKTFWGN